MVFKKVKMSWNKYIQLANLQITKKLTQHHIEVKELQEP